jgi:hypothetical protein
VDFKTDMGLDERIGECANSPAMLNVRHGPAGSPAVPPRDQAVRDVVVSQRAVLSLGSDAASRLNSLDIAIFFLGGAAGSGASTPLFLSGWMTVGLIGGATGVVGLALMTSRSSDTSRAFAARWSHGTDNDANVPKHSDHWRLSGPSLSNAEELSSRLCLQLLRTLKAKRKSAHVRRRIGNALGLALPAEPPGRLTLRSRTSAGTGVGAWRVAEPLPELAHEVRIVVESAGVGDLAQWLARIERGPALKKAGGVLQTKRLDVMNAGRAPRREQLLNVAQRDPCFGRELEGAEIRIGKAGRDDGAKSAPRRS